MTDNSKDKNEESVFRGNEVMMMLEQMSDGIAVIAEEQKALKEGQNKLKEEIQGVRTELKEEIQGVRTELKEEIQGVRTEMNEKFDQVFEFLSNIEDELVAVRKEMERLKKNSATKKELAELDSRIAVLERRFEMANLS